MSSVHIAKRWTISDPKVWIRGNTKIGPVLGVTTSYLQGKYGVEIRIESVNQNHSHSWVRTSHGLHKFVTDLSNNKEDDDNEQEDLWDAVRIFCFENECLLLRADQRLKQTHEDLLLPAHLQQLHLSVKDLWLILSQIILLSLTKRQNNWVLFRHGDLPTEEEGAIEFWSLKDYLRKRVCNVNIGLMRYGRANCKVIPQDKKFYLRALLGQDAIPLIQHSKDNVFSEQFLRVHLSCRMCNQFTYHHKFRIVPGGQHLSDRQTVFCTSVDPMNKELRDPNIIDLEAPRLAWYKQKWKNHQNTVYWVDIKLAEKKGFKFYQTRSDAIILLRHSPSLLYPESDHDGNERNHLR